jgi:hypothetical protein
MLNKISSERYSTVNKKNISPNLRYDFSFQTHT